MMKSLSPALFLLAFLFCPHPVHAGASSPKHADYAVVVTAATRSQPQWAEVVSLLEKKHKATVIVSTNGLARVADALKAVQPRYVCFVARPSEISVDVIREIHIMSRHLDNDPYADFIWGIVTGATAQDAKTVAAASKPLLIKTALTTTGMNFNLVDSALTLSDGHRGEWSMKENGQLTKGLVTNGSSDSLFRDFWQSHDVDLLLTSGHATQANLEMSYSMGSLVCANGDLYCLDRPEFVKWIRRVSAGSSPGQYWFERPECVQFREEWAAQTKIPKLARSTHPKAFFGVGNCLIGDTLQNTDSMLTAFLGAGGVCQFVAYDIPTWYGKGGWGTLDLWQGLPGQISLSEAVYLNNQRILYRLQQENPRLLDLACLDEDPNSAKNQPLAEEIVKAPKDRQQDQFGMMYDRDALVLYGDPLWDVRFDPALRQSPLTWKWDKSAGGALELTITAVRDYSSEALPILLPHRMKNPRVVLGQELNPVSTDKFVLFPKVKFQKGQKYILKLTPTPETASTR